MQGFNFFIPPDCRINFHLVFLSMFFKKKNNKSEKSIGATLYPDKIIIATKNKRDNYTWYLTDCISILPIDPSDLTLGETIIKHLENSKEQVITNDQIRILRENFRKAAKFKTEKAAMQDAKYVSIFLTD